MWVLYATKAYKRTARMRVMVIQQYYGRDYIIRFAIESRVAVIVIMTMHIAAAPPVLTNQPIFEGRYAFRMQMCIMTWRPRDRPTNPPVLYTRSEFVIEYIFYGTSIHTQVRLYSEIHIEQIYGYFNQTYVRYKYRHLCLSVRAEQFHRCCCHLRRHRVQFSPFLLFFPVKSTFILIIMLVVSQGDLGCMPGYHHRSACRCTIRGHNDRAFMCTNNSSQILILAISHRLGTFLRTDFWHSFIQDYLPKGTRRTAKILASFCGSVEVKSTYGVVRARFRLKPRR